ncbi:MAG: hypothetical protein ABJG68_07705 [Crocinitomicaceae bacterium]
MNRIFFFFIGLLLMASCQGNQDTYDWEEDYYEEEDYVETASEFEVEYTDLGLSCDDYYVTLDGYNIKNRVTYGDRVYFNFNDIKGFELEDGELTADMMFLFLSLDGDTLEFTDYGDIAPLELYYTEDEAINLNLNSNMIDPFFSGKSYIYKAGFKDRNSGNALEVQTTVKMVRNSYITSDKNGIKCGDPFIYEEQENAFVTDNYIYKETDYYYGFHGLRGLKEIDGKVELGLSVIIYDEYENESSNSGDIYEEDGWLDAADVLDELSVSFIIYDSYDDELVSVYVKVWDKNSDRSLTVYSDFWIYD